MAKKPKVDFYTVLIILSLLLIQYGVLIFLIVSLMDFATGMPYELWQLIGKLIILTITTVFYYLYRRDGNSKSQQAKLKIYLIGFIVFLIEIGIFYGYLYLIGL